MAAGPLRVTAATALSSLERREVSQPALPSTPHNFAHRSQGHTAPLRECQRTRVVIPDASNSSSSC